MEQVAIFTRGLWRLRGEVAVLSGLEPVRWQRLPRPRVAAIAGWGHAPTTRQARRVAARLGLPYIAIEDGPLRSVRPGPAEPPLSLVSDRTGIYYESAAPSDLQKGIADASWLSPDVLERARAARDQLQRLRLSKYNAGAEREAAELGLGATHRRVLVVDQVQDDASIRGARADAGAFRDMLAAALHDNPGAEIVVKLHPDVLAGRRKGYFAGIAASERVRLVAQPVNPWSLLDAVECVYTVSSGLGFEAALAGRRVVCFGSPFYAGWGFTEDRGAPASRPRAATPLEVFAAYHLRYARYFDSYSRHEIDFETAAEQLAWRRDRFLAQSTRPVCYRMPRWKRRAVERMLDGPAGRPLHAANAGQAVSLAQAGGGPVVVWASRDRAPLLRACRDARVPVTRVEDGFIRSAGLGASFVQPLSLVFDRDGIFYDSGAASGLERMLQEQDLQADLLQRASRLREALVARGTTKYNVGSQEAPRIDGGGRPVVLVPGQVEDDASIRRGSPVIRRNIDLLRAVRERQPQAFILYKPHPDVVAGFRPGRIADAEALALADQIVAEASILTLISACDSVETMTSLAGFEALLRGKRVTTHGQPFYAGWGLTEDLCPPPRRSRRRSLDELVAATLILYPRYLDPVSGLVCPPELLVERLATAPRPAGHAARLLRLSQVTAARLLHLARSARRGREVPR